MNTHTYCSAISVHHTVWTEGGVRSQKASCGRGPAVQAARHETSTHICLKMEHLIYMFKALSIQAAAKVNISPTLVFPKRFSRTLNILTKLSN